MKKFLCIFLSLCTLLALTVIATAQNPPALYLEQAGVCEPGQELSIAVCISDTEIAGGFISVQYDASLFVLKKVELLQAADALSMTYASKDGTLNVLLDGVQNIAVSGQLISLTFAASEEIQPGSYPISCTVPDAASFYALDESGTALSLDVQGCQGELQITAPVLPPCPARYLACQETAVVGGTFALRLCALVADASAIADGSYGFVISITDDKGTREYTEQGSPLRDQIDGGGNIYTAQELGGSIYTVVLTLAAQENTLITVTPYVRLSDSTLYAGSYTLTYQNGNYIGTSQ